MPLKQSYSNLPVAYTSVPSVRLVTDKPAVSSFTGHFTQSGMYLTDAVKADNAWLDDIWQKWQKCSFDSDSVVFWSAYNAQNQAPVQHASYLSTPNSSVKPACVCVRRVILLVNKRIFD